MLVFAMEAEAAVESEEAVEATLAGAPAVLPALPRYAPRVETGVTPSGIDTVTERV